MRRLVTNVSAMEMQFNGECNDGISLTVPDQALTPQELLRKFARGVPVGVDREMIYDSDKGIELPEFNKMDKIDRLHEVQEHKNVVDDLRIEFADQKKKIDASIKASKAKRSEAVQAQKKQQSVKDKDQQMK